MFEVKRKSAPKIFKVKEDSKGSIFRVEQVVNVGEIDVVVKHNCFAFNNGSVAVNDFDTETFTPLNEETEQKLISHFDDAGKAFEVMESVSIDVDDIFSQYLG